MIFFWIYFEVTLFDIYTFRILAPSWRFEYFYYYEVVHFISHSSFVLKVYFVWHLWDIISFFVVSFSY